MGDLSLNLSIMSPNNCPNANGMLAHPSTLDTFSIVPSFLFFCFHDLGHFPCSWEGVELTF